MRTTSLPKPLMTGQNRTRRAPCKLLHCATIFAIMLSNHSEKTLLSLMADGKAKPTHMLLFGFKAFDTVAVKFPYTSQRNMG